MLLTYVIKDFIHRKPVTEKRDFLPIGRGRWAKTHCLKGQGRSNTWPLASGLWPPVSGPW